MDYAKIISIFHNVGYSIIMSSPVIIYFYPKTYKPLIFSQLAILLSWGANNRICILSQLENHFNKKYKIIKAGWLTIISMVGCSICSYFINKYKKEQILLKDRYYNDYDYTDDEFENDIRKNKNKVVYSLIYYDISLLLCCFIDYINKI
jgi:hypothetical protein